MIHTVYSLQLFICVYSFLVSIGIIFIVRDIIFNSRNFGRIREQETAMVVLELWDDQSASDTPCHQRSSYRHLLVCA